MCHDMVSVLACLHVTFITVFALVLPLSRVDGFVEVQTRACREHLATELTWEQPAQLPTRSGSTGQEILNVSAACVPVTTGTQW